MGDVARHVWHGVSGFIVGAVLGRMVYSEAAIVGAMVIAALYLYASIEGLIAAWGDRKLKHGPGRVELLWMAAGKMGKVRWGYTTSWPRQLWLGAGLVSTHSVPDVVVLLTIAIAALAVLACAIVGAVEAAKGARFKRRLVMTALREREM